MFKARLKPSEQGTLERRYGFHLGEAIRAAMEGDYEKAAGHSGTALSISRELYYRSAASARQRYRPGLAAALSSHARYRCARESMAMLTESAGHYAELARADPAAYEVPRIDVLLRVALAADTAGSTRDAIRLLREVIPMYRRAPAADPVARDLSLARASFHLGRCLLNTGACAEGLAHTDAGLAVAEAALSQFRVGQDWLSRAPRHVQLLAPDWAAAASRAMTLHAAAGQWPAAATAASTAVRLTAGMAAIGGDSCQQTHVAILARARAIWARAGIDGIQYAYSEHALARQALTGGPAAGS